MNESPTNDPQPAQVFGGATAFRVGAVLLIGIALVLALAIFDRQRRAQIEGWQEVTAVGDVKFFAPPSDPAAPAAISWEGRLFQIPAGERVKLRDTEMHVAGSDAAAGITIYRQLDPKGSDAAERYYVKVAPGEYLPAVNADQ